MMSLSERFHEVDLALEGLIGKSVRVQARTIKHGPMKGLHVSGFRGTIRKLKWHPKRKEHYFELNDNHNRTRVAPARCVPVAVKILKGGKQ